MPLNPARAVIGPELWGKIKPVAGGQNAAPPCGLTLTLLHWPPCEVPPRCHLRFVPIVGADAGRYQGMLTMLCRLVRSLIPLLSITILIVAVCSASVRGQELPKQEPGNPPDTKQHSGTYTRGAKDSPVVIEIGPSAPLKIEADHDTEGEKAKSVNEGRIATGTIVIAVFTLVLAFATICLTVFTSYGVRLES